MTAIHERIRNLGRQVERARWRLNLRGNGEQLQEQLQYLGEQRETLARLLAELPAEGGTAREAVRNEFDVALSRLERSLEQLVARKRAPERERVAADCLNHEQAAVTTGPRARTTAGESIRRSTSDVA